MLYKHCPDWVYAVGKIVPHGVLVPINHVLHLWCCPEVRAVKEWRSSQDIDII
jgi:hypothetical protein